MGGEAGKEKILSRYKVVRHDLGGRGFSGDNFLCGAQNDEGGCHSARLGESDAEWIVNVWVKSMPCNPGTSTVLPSKRACVQRTAAFTDIRRTGARGVTALRRWSPPHYHHPIPPLSLRAKKELGLVERPLYFASFRGFQGRKCEKKLRQGFRNTVYVCRMRSLKKKKTEASSMRGGLWGGEKLKEFTTSH